MLGTGVPGRLVILDGGIACCLCDPHLLGSPGGSDDQDLRRPERREPSLTKIQIPPTFARSTIAREGAAGQAWIRSLPSVVSDLCSYWGLTVVGPVLHGYVAVVVPVVRESIRLALKVSWKDRHSEHEALALRAWAGRGAVQLLDERGDEGALLLEWLDPSKTLLAPPADEAAGTAGRLLRTLAVPAPPLLRTVQDEAAEFLDGAEGRWADLQQPFSSRLLRSTMDAALAVSSARSGALVNQDLHYENVLQGRGAEWLTIDPKPLSGDVEFGIAPLLWNRFEELGGSAGLTRRLDIIVEACDGDAEQARTMTLLRTVDYWLWGLEQGLTEDPARCRSLVDWLVPKLAT